MEKMESQPCFFDFSYAQTDNNFIYIWICVGSICVGNSDISNNQGVLRHVTQIEKRRRIFGEILSRDIFYIIFNPF